MFTFSGILISQDEIKPDSRLFARYSENQIQTWINENPSVIILKNIQAEHGYKFTSMDKNKSAKFDKLRYFNSESKKSGDPVRSIDKSSFNIYKYHYKRLYDKRKYYKIGNTGEVLIILSHKELAAITNKIRNYD